VITETRWGPFEHHDDWEYRAETEEKWPGFQVDGAYTVWQENEAGVWFASEKMQGRHVVKLCELQLRLLVLLSKAETRDWYEERSPTR